MNWRQMVESPRRVYILMGLEPEWDCALPAVALRALAAAPGQPDPDSVVEAYQDYRCTLCGTELTVRMASVSETSPPRHCREEMVAVWRPDSPG